MSANDFCNWLQGYFELANPMSIGVSETAMIREHLELAGKDKTPYYSESLRFGIKNERERIAIC